MKEEIKKLTLLLEKKDLDPKIRVSIEKRLKILRDDTTVHK
jgi:hypothetical protein